MKINKIKIFYGAAVLVLNLVVGFTGQAQSGMVNFGTALGSGTFTIDVNHLALFATPSNGANYVDSEDSLDFNGTVYDHLIFGVYNDYTILNQQDDGFFVMASTGSFGSYPDITLNAFGSGLIINGTSTSDLMTMLGSFDNLFSGGGVYPNPDIAVQADSASQPVNGSLNSFELTSVPEPAAFPLLGMGVVAAIFYRRRIFNAD